MTATSLDRELTLREGDPMSRSRRGRHAPLLALLGLALLLAGCAPNAPQDSLDPEGPVAREIHNLVGPVFLVAAAVFVVVEVGVLFLVWKFRQRRHDDETVPRQVHGHIPLELGWTIVPAAILMFIAVPTVATIFSIANWTDNNGSWDGKIEVVGKQWWWEYRYDLDGDGEVDFYTANDLVIPEGLAVELAVTSADVIHSYWIPKLNGKMDAVPGRHSPLILETDGPGTFIGQCTEFCGLSHGYMHQRVVALPAADFDEWAQNQREPVPADLAQELTDIDNEAPEAQGAQLFATQCSSCHLVRGVNNEEFQELYLDRERAGEATDLVAGRGPDLTHLMSRGVFAGGLFNLWQPADDDGVTPQWSDIGGTLNRGDLAAWLRNPPGQKPMAPDEGRGMPDFGLSEEQISQLIAFFETLD